MLQHLISNRSNVFLFRVNKIILRLREAGATDLVRFAKELRLKIKDGLRAQEVEFKLEKFFERSIQLLLIAEKAFNFSGDSGAKNELQVFDNLLNRNLYEVSDSLKFDDPDIITLLTLVDERERNQFTHYVLSINYLEKYILKIVASGTKKGNLEFAKEFYKRAFLAYEKQRYELSTKLFDSMLKYFQFLEHSSKQRIEYFSAFSLFYSNKYGFAQEKLEKMLKTPMADRAIAYAISDVYRINGDFDKLLRITERYENLPNTNMINNDHLDDEFYFKSAHAFFKHKKYKEAIEYFGKVRETYNLFYDAKLLIAMSKYGIKDNSASSDFEELIENSEASLRVVTTALIKRAQISYENKEYALSLDYLSNVDDSNVEDIEEYYTTKAWSLFSYITTNDSLEKNYAEVEIVIETFLDIYQVSDFTGEMRTLLGYVKKLSDNFNWSGNRISLCV